MFMLLAPTTVLAQNFYCEDLTINEKKPTDESKKLQQNYIITILEEEIADTSSNLAPTDNTNYYQVLNCMRQTTCVVADEKSTCTSSYVEPTECSPDGGKVFCQRVQVLITQSGLTLLMLYLKIIYQWAAGVIGIVSVAYMIWGGFTIATAQDDTSSIDKAKERIFQSLGGLILLFLSAVILYTINPNFFAL